LNPRMTFGEIMSEPLVIHSSCHFAGDSDFIAQFENRACYVGSPSGDGR